jgi:predicted lipoprotein with Yx(FWY)xxD motif
MIAATLAVSAAFAAMAFAANSLTVGSASNSSLGERVLINPQGRTLYALHPETSKHLLCKTGECLRFWPPLTVPSRTTRLEAGAGVHGRLGMLRRSSGILQVTLGGLPLYRFANDHKRGEANGEGIKSFGGTWHAVKASGTTPAAPSMPQPAPPTPSTPAPGYGY